MDKEDWFIASIVLGSLSLLFLAMLCQQAQENNNLWQQAIKRGYAEEVHTSNGTYYKWKELK